MYLLLFLQGRHSLVYVPLVDCQHELPLTALLIEVDLQDLVLGEEHLVKGIANPDSLLGRAGGCPEAAELTKDFPSMASILEEMQTIRCIEHDGHRKFITLFDNVPKSVPA